jgi:thiol-disulfide isomerase/thioredoxin
MRLCLIFSLYLASAFSNYLFSQAIDKKVLLSGVVKNFSNVVQIYDKSDIGAILLPDPNMSFIPDSMGRFSISFDLHQARYFKIGRNTLFLSPGDSLCVFIDYENNEIARFSGIHSEENNFLRFTPFPKAGSYLNGGLNVKRTIEQTIAYVIDTANKKLSELNTHKTFSKQFNLLEKARVTADILNSFFKLDFYFPRRNGITGDSLIAFQNSFMRSIKPYTSKYMPKYVNPDFLKLEIYRDMLGTVINFTDTTQKSFSKISDWSQSMRIVYQMQTSNDKSGISTIEKNIKRIRTPEYRDAVLSTFKGFRRMNGEYASNIVMKDTSGNEVQLNAFANKVIFIDLWATWCGPCIEQQPYLDSLRKEFKNHKDVIILSLSVDGELSIWKQFLNRKKLPGIQFMTNYDKLAGYYVSELPRTIIITKSFRIAAMRGPKPSDKESSELIKSLLSD